MVERLCKCGCGQLVVKETNTYILGHVRKGQHLSDEAKKKISIANSLSHKGKILSKETKRKISQSRSGYIVTKETKRKISEGLKGKHPSEETRKKLSLGHAGNHNHRGHKHSEKTRALMRKKRALQRITRTSSIEIKIHEFLKKLNILFIPHIYINDISLPYQCDIYIPQYNLIIECDGDYWHNRFDMVKKDSIRTKEMIGKGYKVLRLWEHDIRNMDIETFKWKLDNSQELLYPICIIER